MVSRLQAAGLPLAGLVASFAIVLGLGSLLAVQADDEPAEGQVKAAQQPARASLTLQVRATDPAPSAAAGQPQGSASGTPQAPAKVTLCLTPGDNWSVPAPADGWTEDADGTICRDVTPAAADPEQLDVTMAKDAR